MSGNLPAGFRENASGSGLLVPEPLSRVREVIPRSAWRWLERVIAQLLGPNKLRFAFFCDKPGCPEPQVTRVRQPDGGFLLRCGCSDRVYHPSI